jgi:hypothetical protein
MLLEEELYGCWLPTLVAPSRFRWKTSLTAAVVVVVVAAEESDGGRNGKLNLERRRAQ